MDISRKSYKIFLGIIGILLVFEGYGQKRTNRANFSGWNNKSRVYSAKKNRVHFDGSKPIENKNEWTSYTKENNFDKAEKAFLLTRPPHYRASVVTASARSSRRLRLVYFALAVRASSIARWL